MHFIKKNIEREMELNFIEIWFQLKNITQKFRNKEDFFIICDVELIL